MRRIVGLKCFNLLDARLNRMDTFMDKFAQRKKAQGMIDANAAADAANMEKLKRQVNEYELLYTCRKCFILLLYFRRKRFILLLYFRRKRFILLLYVRSGKIKTSGK